MLTEKMSGEALVQMFFSVAQPKAKDELAEICKPRKAESALASGMATFEDAAHVYEERTKGESENQSFDPGISAEND